MSGEMFRAKSDPTFAARLIARAKALAEARAERLRTRRAWRSARLLWPLFTKG